MNSLHAFIALSASKQNTQRTGQSLGTMYRGGSTYGPNWHRPTFLTDKSCKFSLFGAILGLYQPPAPPPPFGSRSPFLHILNPPLMYDLLALHGQAGTEADWLCGTLCVVVFWSTHYVQTAHLIIHYLKVFLLTNYDDHFYKLTKFIF